MKKLLLAWALIFGFFGSAQQIVLKKGAILDSLAVRDTVSETFSLYLPTNFETDKVWPVVFVFDMDGKGKQALSMFKQSAEEQGFLLAASNNLSDTLSLSKNILITRRLINTVVSIFPVHKNRIYAGGFSKGAKFATIVPTFLQPVNGVISCGATIANTEVLTSKNPFHLVGIVGTSDYNYPDILAMESTLNRLRVPNQLLIFDGVHEWPSSDYISKAMKILDLGAMAKGKMDMDSLFVANNYRDDLARVSRLLSANKPLQANHYLDEMMEIYRPFRPTDSIKDSGKVIRKTSRYKTQNRTQNNLFLKEQFSKEDYAYYMEEDLLTYNYNNLGWWKYQMEELSKYKKNPDILTQQMGNRLDGYVKALLEDNLEMLADEDTKDWEGLNFLYMLQTILEPKNEEAYLNVISLSSKLDDFGAALFYLEELLKTGYKNQNKLYSLDYTAILRITPEFNEVVEKYLKKARYEVVPN
ncbi:alpha/beta hydrolase [Euzebyella saccharophila]|uniref:Alpha/beta hydrolase n=1 Tax=Euzebyella saccharophila TaxID=679664 RepID=A0ABV8JIW4_9FLAO|nr:alpha/beta hydrolase [Euzebyella saccharophila]